VSFHPVAIVHRVADIEAAAAFLRDVVKLAEQERGPGWIVLDNGRLCVRLERTAEVRNGEVRVEIATKDLDASTRVLLEHAGVQIISDPCWVAPHRQETRLAAPHGFELVLFREYNEDELGITPPLRKQLRWNCDAEELTKEVLRVVPLAFRAQVREETTRMAELAAVEDGNAEVLRSHAARGLIRAAPEAQRARVRRGLNEAGLSSAELDLID
jgi:hypothetical protein